MREAPSLAGPVAGVSTSTRLVREADDGARSAPEFFEAVVGALIGRKDVDDDVSEVEQHPAVVAAAFAMAKFDTIWQELLFQVVAQGTKLERRLRGGYHEEIGERRHFRNINQRDI